MHVHPIPSPQGQHDEPRPPDAAESDFVWRFAVGGPAGRVGAEFERVTLLMPDRLQLEMLRSCVAALWPHAIVSAVRTVAEARDALQLQPGEILITDVVALDGDVVDAITEWTRDAAAPLGVFVVTAHKEANVLHALANTPICGVFDQTNEGPDELKAALTLLREGRVYWSPSVREAVERTCISQESLFRQLTFTERLVLGVIGDGCDDATAAGILSMSETTVMTVRRNLHRKLGIQHKGELVRRATAYGFVLSTPHGITRPGLAGMLAARNRRFRKRHSADVLSLPKLARVA